MATNLRFLGIMITSDGRFAPWRDEYDKNLYALQAKLSNVGLGRLPVAIVNGIFVSIMPSLLFGCEIWGIEAIYNILFCGKNPYAVEFLAPVQSFLRNMLSLPPNSSTALLHRFLSFPSFLRLVLPRMAKLFALL